MERFELKAGIGFVLLLAFVFAVAGGCASTQSSGYSSSSTYARIAGDWEEDWPNASFHDVFRASMAGNGRTLILVPVTNANKQRLSNITWDGTTLRFINTFSNQNVRYQLRMNGSGTALVGTATMANGTVKQITWRRKSSGSSTQTSSAQPYNASLNDWMGIWEEDWPNSNTHDRYGIELSQLRNSLDVVPLTNLQKQRLTNVRYAGNVLSFTLQYNQAVWNYQLVPKKPNVLVGQVKRPSDSQTRTIVWRRVATSAPSIPTTPPSGLMQGIWEERWPNRQANDRYQMIVSGQTLQIRPLTAVDRQRIYNIRVSGNRVNFTLQYDQKVWYYSLVLSADGRYYSGDVVAHGSGTQRSIQWLRLSQAPVVAQPQPQPVQPQPVQPQTQVAQPQPTVPAYPVNQTITAPPPASQPVQPPTTAPAPPPPVAHNNVGRIYLVAVGISRYKNTSIKPLRYADRDARAFAQQMQSLPNNAVHPQHVRLLLNEQATLKNVKEALTVFLKETIAEDVVYIYFAGHGSPEPDNPDNMYFLTHDTDPANMAVTALPMWDIETFLQRYIKAERVVVLADTCHSGGIGPQMGPRAGGIVQGDGGSAVNRYFHSLATAGSGRTIFTASEPNEMSFEGENYGGGHGAFTHFLLQGMRGAADLDHDNIITLGELADYVDAEVRRATNSRQHPYLTGEINRNLPVTVVGE